MFRCRLSLSATGYVRNMALASNFSGVIRRCLWVSSRPIVDAAGKEGELRVFIVAGEVSGDTIAYRLIQSLKKLSPLPIRFSGVGGSMMSKQGLKSLFPMEEIAVMGMWELLPHLYSIRVKIKETVEAALLYRPHVVVTVDSKGFCFRFLKQLRARYQEQNLDCPVHFHYVAPSFWAWKGGEQRLQNLAGFVDHVLCILPNEEPVLKSNGLNATFVGHPILEDVFDLNSGNETMQHEWRIKGNGEDFRRKYDVPSGATIMTLLPGSRIQEVTTMLPIFANTMQLLKKSYSELMNIIIVAPNQHVDKYVSREIRNWPVPAIPVSGELLGLKYDALSASRVALCTSGTVAMELQLARLPCVVTYRAHLLTEWVIRYKAKIPYISLPNILLDSPVIPELLFQGCTPVKLASLLKELMEDMGLQEKQIVAGQKVMELICPPVNSFREHGIISDYRPSMMAASTILRQLCMLN